MNKKVKWTCLFCVGVLTLTCISVSLKHYHLPRIEEISIRPGTLEKTYQTDGVVGLDFAYVMSKKETLLAPKDGKIIQLQVKEMEQVEKGQALCSIVDDTSEVLQTQVRIDELAVEMTTLGNQQIQLEDRQTEIARDILRYEENLEQLALDEALVALQKEMPALVQDRDMNKALYALGAVSEKDYLLAEKKLMDTEEKYRQLHSEKENEFLKMIDSLVKEDAIIGREIKLNQQQLDGLMKKKELLALETKSVTMLAPISGYIYGCDKKEGTMAREGESLLTIIPLDVPYGLSFEIPIGQAQLVEEGDSILFWIDTAKQEGTIVEKKIGDDTKKFQVTAEVDRERIEQLGFTKEDPIEVVVKATKKSQAYDAIVPLSALKKEKNSYSVFAIQSQRGAFGETFYVEELPVQVLAENNYEAAIEGVGLKGRKIVKQSSKPLKDGDEVYRD
ncbi:MAG: hypothetical protein ACRDDX_04565 [Cellulosilyticaceae bacterium]